MNMQATIKFNNSDNNIFEFIKGQRDCRNGAPHQAGHTESYDNGYSFQYHLEQVLSERSKQSAIH